MKHVKLFEQFITESKFPGKKGEFIYNDKEGYVEIKKTAGSTAYVKWSYTSASAFNQVWADEVKLSDEKHKGKKVWLMESANAINEEREDVGKNITEKKITISWNDDENSIVFSDGEIAHVDYDGEFKYRDEWFSTVDHTDAKDLIKDLQKRFKRDKFEWISESYITEAELSLKSNPKLYKKVEDKLKGQKYNRDAEYHLTLLKAMDPKKLSRSDLDTLNDFDDMYESVVTEAKNDGNLDTIADYVKQVLDDGKSFMDIGKKLKGAYKYDFSTGMMPMYIIPVSGNKIVIINKKYVENGQADRIVGDIAIGLMENIKTEITNMKHIPTFESFTNTVNEEYVELPGFDMFTEQLIDEFKEWYKATADKWEDFKDDMAEDSVDEAAKNAQMEILAYLSNEMNNVIKDRKFKVRADFK